MMKCDIERELGALERMSVGDLQDRYVEVFSEPVRSRHRAYLIRRIAWRLQANAEGGFSERALRRAEELACDADVRVTPPRGTDVGGGATTCRGGEGRPRVGGGRQTGRDGRGCRGGRRHDGRVGPDGRPERVTRVEVATDPRLPAAGASITRRYKGRLIVVTVRADAFEYEGERYRSLSAVAKAITGSHMNGFRFFKLEGRS